MFLREQWVHNKKNKRDFIEVVAAPARPQKKETNDLARAATKENIRLAIGEEIRCEDFSIPNLPDLPKRPDRSPAPTVSVAAPDKTLATTAQELPNGEKYSLAAIDHVIAYRSKWRYRLTFAKWQDGLKVKHFKQARSTLIDKVFDHTGEVLHGSVGSQQTYGKWLADDMSKAGHYARNIRHTADKHTAVLDDMKSLEVEMDRHWTYLEGRLAGLNMAGKLIEQCSIRSFNQLAAAPEWQRLEWQNQRLLDAPKSKHGIHLASINAEKTATDSSPTANKEAIIPSAPPARANRTTRSFQAQAADTMRRDEMSEDGIHMTKVNRHGVLPSADEVASLEKLMGHKLPKSFMDIFCDLNAEHPSSNSFKVSKRKSDELVKFYKFARFADEYEELNRDGTPRNEDEADEMLNPTLEGSYKIEGMMPFAETGKSRLVLSVNESRPDYGHVYYWHRDDDFHVNKIVDLAPSLPEFMKLVKYEPPTVIPPEIAAKIQIISVAGVTRDELDEAHRKEMEILKRFNLD